MLASCKGSRSSTPLGIMKCWMLQAGCSWPNGNYAEVNPHLVPRGFYSSDDITLLHARVMTWYF
jgi:hypothetical protein